MTLPLILRPPARADALSAHDWYDEQRPGLGSEFTNALEELLGRIQVAPELYAVAYEKVRRAKLKRFPYVIYYRIQGNCVEVIAVLHGHRDPRIWHERL